MTGDFHMTFGSLLQKAAALAVLALAAAGSAQARDVYWSVGVHAAPGVTVGVGNHRPVYVQPAPVYAHPPVVYAPPPVVYTPPQVVYPHGGYLAGPVVVQRGPVYRSYDDHGRRWHRGHGHGHGHHKHWKKHRHWDD
jgi:hypothetical protein